MKSLIREMAQSCLRSITRWDFELLVPLSRYMWLFCKCFLPMSSFRSGPSPMCWSAVLSCFTLGPSVLAAWPKTCSNRPKSSFRNTATLKFTKDTARPSAREFSRTSKKTVPNSKRMTPFISTVIPYQTFTLIPRCFCSDQSNTNEGQVWMDSVLPYTSWNQTLDSTVVSSWSKDHEKPAVGFQN